MEEKKDWTQKYLEAEERAEQQLLEMLERRRCRREESVGTWRIIPGEQEFFYWLRNAYETKNRELKNLLLLYEGEEYYPDGTIFREGIFQRAGLLEGRVYYPSGKLKFEGKYCLKYGEGHDYYGPSYPKEGRFYAENGQLIYEGKFQVMHKGNAGWPVVTYPEDFVRPW